MSFVQAAKGATVSQLFDGLQLVRSLLTNWRSQIVISNADKLSGVDKRSAPTEANLKQIGVTL